MAMTLRKNILPVIFAAVAVLVSSSSYANLVKWTLDGVTFAIYPIADGHPMPVDTINPSGWFIVDTRSHQIVDFEIRGVKSSPIRRGENGFGGPCTPYTNCDHAAWESFVSLGSVDLPNAQLFSFFSQTCGHCERAISFAALTNLPFDRDPGFLPFTDEWGGTVKLASGAYDSGNRGTGYDYGGYLISGSLIGTVVPEPSLPGFLAVGLMTVGVILRRTTRQLPSTHR
jgi:hypothetical protein